MLTCKTISNNSDSTWLLQVKKHQWRVTFQILQFNPANCHYFQGLRTLNLQLPAPFAIQILKMQIGMPDSTAIITSHQSSNHVMAIGINISSIHSDWVFIFFWMKKTGSTVRMFRVPVILRIFVQRRNPGIPEFTLPWHATNISLPSSQNLLKYQHRHV